MKNCGMCKEDKPEEDFAWKVQGKRLQSHCRVCQREYRRIHYENNKQMYIDKAAKWREEQKIIFYSWLSRQECTDCRNSDMRVLEFDHLDNKDYDIGKKIGVIKFEVLMEEVAKCEIVCANCHKIRTCTRGNFYRYLAIQALR